MKNGRRHHPWELPASMAIEDRIQAELEHELAAIEKGKPVPALANWPSVVEDAPESRPPSRGCGAGDACVSRPATPTQNRLKLKRSTTEDAVADERLAPIGRGGGGTPRRGWAAGDRRVEAVARSTGGGGRDYPRAAGRRGRDAPWTARARRRRGACRPACWPSASTRTPPGVGYTAGGRARVEAPARPRTAGAEDF